MTILCLKKKGQWIFFTLILKLFRVLFITYWFCVLKAVKDRFCSKLQKCEYNSNLQLPKPAPVLHPAQAEVECFGCCYLSLWKESRAQVSIFRNNYAFVH